MTVGRIPSVEGGIQPTIFDAKADLLTATANDTPARLAVGTNNQVVMADSAQATGLKYANEATATLTTTGDTLYASGANTLARRAIGTTGQVLTVSGGVPTWATPAGGGKILQVVQATTTTSTTIASTTLTDTTITATITPTSATSKVLIMIASSSTQYRGSDASYAGARLLRGGTTISDWGTALWSGSAVTGGNTEVYLRHNQSIVYLDSPATTSATTYKLQSAVSTTADSANINFQAGSSPSVIILMEVGA